MEKKPISPDAKRAVGAAFVLNPAERPSCAAIAQSRWLEERPVLRIAQDFKAFYGRCVIAEACLPMDALAQLRSDEFFEPARQKELELSFTQKPKIKENARIRCTESVEPHGVVKLTLTGHLGRGSAASSINDLANTEPLPYSMALTFGQWFIDRNEGALTELGNAMAAEAQRHLRREIVKAFPSGVVPKGKQCPHKWRNVRDVIHADWRSTLLTCPQLHIQKALGKEVLMPRHLDGGRGLVVLCVRIFGGPTLRLWRADDTTIEVPSGPGHVYMTSILAPEHQVVHAGRSNESDLHESAELGATEVTLFIRSATLAHNRCSNAGRLWGDDIDGKLCAALNDAFVSWQLRHALELPTGAELRAARRQTPEGSRPAKRRRLNAAR